MSGEDSRVARTSGRFSIRDVLSGSITAIANVPDAMANAALVGVSPLNGLYALLFGSPAASLTTSSQYLTVATTAAMALAAGDALQLVPQGERLAALGALVLLVGVLSIVLGLLRADSFLRFVSNAVMRGFLTGVAVSIVANQIPELFGSSSELPSRIAQAFDVILHPGRADLATLTVGASTLAVILLVERWGAPKIATLVGLIVVTAFVSRTGWSPRLVGDIASIPQMLPGLQVPSVGMILALAPSAVAVALIGLVQTAGISKTTPNPDGTYPVIARDFLGQGVGNVASSLVGGIPVGGSVSSTALNIQAGARSRWSNFVIGPFIAGVLLLMAPWVELIPMASLAAVLILVGIRAVDVPRIMTVWNTSWTSGFVMASTFAATLLMPIQYAVMLGAVLSIIQHVYSSSLDVKVVALRRDAAGRFGETRAPESLDPGEVVVLDIYGSIFFAGADVIEKELPDPTDADGAVVILRLRGRVDVGSTFLGVLRRYRERLASNGGTLLLAGVGPKLHEQLRRTGLLDEIGHHAVFRATPYITESLDAAVRIAEEWRSGRLR